MTTTTSRYLWENSLPWYYHEPNGIAVEWALAQPKPIDALAGFLMAIEAMANKESQDATIAATCDGLARQDWSRFRAEAKRALIRARLARRRNGGVLPAKPGW